MNGRDKLYQMFNQAEEDRKRKNFDAFMDGLETGLVNDLDKKYWEGNQEEYFRILNNIKSQGIRVFRNSKGQHKISFI